MKNRERRVLLLITLLVVAGALRWLLFGVCTHDNPSLGYVTARRWFGRSVTLENDSDRDGVVDSITKFTWAHPVGLRDGVCGDPFWLWFREDRDLDHRWDTWVDRPDPSDPCRLVVRADLDADGLPDLTKETTFGDLQALLLTIDSDRGFPDRRPDWMKVQAEVLNE